MLTTQPLARVVHLKPVASAWLWSEWSAGYAVGGAGGLAGDGHAFAVPEAALPVGWVVFEENKPVGLGARKERTIGTHNRLTPSATAASTAAPALAQHS